jgi:putative acetyltransferase
MADVDLRGGLKDEKPATAAIRPTGPKTIKSRPCVHTSIETSNGPVPAAALAPVAVFPDHQRRGIGGQLIRSGLDLLRERGEQIVIVLGHPGYYPRFGFSSEKARSLASPFPPEAFMAMELSPGALDGIRGKVRYPAAFGL